MNPRPQKDTFCSYCGTAFTVATYPRTCEGCKTTHWSNPIPVVVVLVPVFHDGQKGLLVIRRGIEPKMGLLAIPGGFLEDHETYREGGAREVREETGIDLRVASIRPFWFASTEPKPNRVLLFVECDPLRSEELPPPIVNHETTERGLVFGPDGLEKIFAFELHARAAERWFLSQGIEGPAAYLPR